MSETTLIDRAPGALIAAAALAGFGVPFGVAQLDAQFGGLAGFGLGAGVAWWLWQRQGVGEGEREEAAVEEVGPAVIAEVGPPPSTWLRRLPATEGRPAMVPIGAGSFLMGSPDDETGRLDGETPHRVTLTRSYWMAETPVTQAQYRAVTGRNPARFQGLPEDDTRPVEQVSWRDAVAYCNTLSETNGLMSCYAIDGTDVAWRREADGYRLPTEAEWEYAARAGTATATYAGDLDIKGDQNAPVLDAIAWYGGNSGADHPKAWGSSGWAEKQHPHERTATQPVGSKQPNEWGLYDTLGNLWEWVWDWRADYPTMPIKDPAGPHRGVERVIRGGSFDDAARRVRAACRFGWHPGFRSGSLGFRVVRRASLSHGLWLDPGPS